ncbi:MAG: acyl-ACP--UDP-N-acetylglucosamine O-acyltransferase [Synergistaceae bacterium]|jgi:UDP-N-acetylglucosamine acyltransferase|nr:acyl-ACP--UDP-N-acetylglucosamine O-acyltransferase [Synergistaceae bacterium]
MSSSILIHPTAIVSPDAIIGNNVRIGPYSIIDARAKIGDGTTIESFVHVTSFAEIGRNCHIFEYTAIGGTPQDHDFGNEISYVRIADDVILRENITIHRATGEGCETVVGQGTMLMEGCHLGHNVNIGKYCTVTNKVGFSGYVQLGDYVVVGGLTGFHQFVRVGSYAMVGGMTKAIKDIPPYSLVDGNPAFIYGLNTVGLRRRGFTQEQRTHIKNIYRMLFDRKLKRREAIAMIEERFPGDDFAREIVSFANSTRRGLFQWHRRGTYHVVHDSSEEM